MNNTIIALENLPRTCYSKVSPHVEKVPYLMPKNLPVKKDVLSLEAQSSHQFDLFTFSLGLPAEHSNTIEFYDSIPKYAITTAKQNRMRDDRGNMKPQKVHFVYRPTLKSEDGSEIIPREIPCVMTISPAQIEEPDGSYKHYFPSIDEELVEEVLRKMLAEQQYGLHLVDNPETFVRYTVYLIGAELKRRNKTRSHAQIQKAIKILNETKYQIQAEGLPNGFEFKGSILPEIITKTRSDFQNDPKSPSIARFSALVSHGINKLYFRQYNWVRLMDLKSDLARWLFKRMAHQFTNASMTIPFCISYSEIGRDSGYLDKTRQTRNFAAVDKAWKELKKGDVIFRDVEKNPIYEGKKIIDIKYTVWASPNFKDEIVKANLKRKRALEQLGRR